MNLQELSEEMVETARALDGRVAELEDLARISVQNSHARDLAYAKALLRAEGGSAEQRKAQAFVATEHLQLKAEMAQSAEKVQRDVIHTTRAKLSALQSVANAEREAMRLAR